MFDPQCKAAGPGANGWPADRVFNDWAKFVGVFWASSGCYVVIDEAGSVCAKHEHALELRKMLQQGRHQLHTVALAAQRYTDLDKTARSQCTQLFAFTQCRDDAKDLAADWICDELAELHTLQPLHYIAISKPERIPRRGVLTF